MKLSPSDMDFLIRTAYGEARGESPEGQAAVMHTVLNRLNTGRWGNDVRSVVLAKNQFEPWGNLKTKAALMALKPDDPRYQKLAEVAQQVTSGSLPDPTQGATHFMSPSVQQAMGRNVPAWAQNPLAQIGNHNFYAPDGVAKRPPSQPAVDEIGNLLNSMEVTDPELLAKFEAASASDAPRPVEADPLSVDMVNKGVDNATGAPMSVREAVGGAPTPLDRIRELRKSYPDAKPYGSDNYVYTNPETGKPTLYNEKNPRVFGIPIPTKGDVASFAREGSQMVGAGLGALAATPAAVAGAPFSAGSSLLAIPAAAGGGAVIGDKAYDFIRAMVGRGDSRTPMEQVKDAGATFGVNAVGQALAGVAPIALKNVFTTTKNRVAEMAPEALQALSEKLGIKLTAGQVTGLPALNFMERAANNSLSAGGKMNDFYKNQVSKAQGLLMDMADTTAKGKAFTNDSVGQGIQQGIQGWRGDVAHTTGQLSKKFWKHFQEADGLSEQVPAANLWRTMTGDVQHLAKSGAPNSAASIASNKTLQRYMDEIGKDIAANAESKLSSAATAAGPGVLSKPTLPSAATMAEGSNYPIEALSMLRSRIGDELSSGQGDLFHSVGERQLQRMYGAISEDLKAAARTKGAGATKAFEDLNRYYAAAATRSKNYLNQMTTAKPEDVYNIAMAGSGKSGEQLRALRRSVKPEQWDQLVAHNLEMMGRAKPGAQNAAGDAFSVDTMLTNWNKMSPEAKDILFSGPNNKAMRQSLDELMSVGTAIKGSEKFINRSQTAGTLQAMGGGAGAAGVGAIVAGLPGAVVAALGKEGANFLTAKMMTSPAVVKFLAEAGKNANNPGAISQALARLTASASDEGARDFMNAYHKQKQPIKTGKMQ